MNNWMLYYFKARNALMLIDQEDESGQSLAEYGLILALVAVVAITAVSLLGSTISDYLEQVANGFSGDNAAGGNAGGGDAGGGN